MKKYLMTGMAAIALCAAFTSCSKGSDLYDQGAVDQREIQKTENTYSNNFIKIYGQPAADQDWGFAAYESKARAFTRGEFANMNEYRKYYVVPNNVDLSVGGERDMVVAEFSKKREGAVNTVNINFTDFFVFHVYRGTKENNTYKAGNDGDVYAPDQMNHLQTYVGGKMDQGGRREHMNNFNCSDNQNTVDGITGAMVMKNSGTADFSYHNTQDSKYHNEYIIIPGADIHPSLAGYYYIGFDFLASGAPGTNQEVGRDWIFNDWIVRISPAEFLNCARVICEDLGTTDDFDFNDVVFDVNPAQYDENGQQYTLITLRAAGGTLPLYLNAGSVSNEVHSLFGVDTNIMVNTNNGTVSRPVAQFTIPGSYTPSQIAVVVQEDAIPVTLKAEEGEAPQKICVNTTFEWCNERQQIGEKFENFPAYVQNKQIAWY